MACPDSFPSSHGEKSKSGQDLAPDKLGCTTTCQGCETDPIFLADFSEFLSTFHNTANRDHYRSLFKFYFVSRLS